MKKIIFSVLVISSVLSIGCSSNDNKNEQANHDMSAMGKDSMPLVTPPADKEVKAVAVTYTNMDPKITAVIKETVDHYLHIKNALAGDNGSEAASGGVSMAVAMKKIDKSLFTAEQKKIYDDIEDDLKEHAEHIGKNGSNIKHQREHFSMMSNDVYALVRAFGGGRVIYHDHCPMYDDKKGAMWLSELKEIKNPYMGAQMPACGTVEEMIK